MNNDTFHLESFADCEALKPAPRTVITWESLGLPRAFPLKGSDSSFYVLGSVPRGHKYGVWHSDCDNVLQANANEMLALRLGAQECTVAVDSRRWA